MQERVKLRRFVASVYKSSEQTDVLRAAAGAIRWRCVQAPLIRRCPVMRVQYDTAARLCWCAGVGPRGSR